jgi:PII-like signaling protein
MRLHGPASRLTIFVGESHLWHHRPLYTEIIHRAHRAGLAGASAFRGIEGYGASSRIHTNRLLGLGQQMPVAIVIVDEEARIKAFLPELDEIVAQGLIILDDVEVYRYLPDTARPERGQQR